MKGHLFKRKGGSWVAVLTLGYRRDPQTGKVRQKQKWLTLRGCRTKKEAQVKLRDHLHAVDHDAFVEPSKVTLGEWLRKWVENAVKPPLSREATYVRYKGIIENHIV